MKTNRFKPPIFGLRRFVFLFIVIAFQSMTMMGKIAFAYDAAGNRVKRELVVTQKSNAPSQSAGVNDTFYDSIGDKSVTLSSDGSGNILISIRDFDVEDIGRITVYTLSGINVLDQNITDSTISIDLSSNPTGVYVLSVIVNGNQTTWKITKK